MEDISKSEEGIIDTVRNPFSQKSWVEQGFPLTQHRRDQAELLLSKTVEEISSLDANSGSYPAFVAIRWNYAEIKGSRLSPTAKWTEWQPSDQRQRALNDASGDSPEKTNQPQGYKPRRRSISNSKRYDVLRRDKFQCVLCGASGSEAKLEVDHLIPVSQGGTDDIGNLRCLCFRCNRGKHAKIESID